MSNLDLYVSEVCLGEQTQFHSWLRSRGIRAFSISCTSRHSHTLGLRLIRVRMNCMLLGNCASGTPNLHVACESAWEVENTLELLFQNRHPHRSSNSGLIICFNCRKIINMKIPLATARVSLRNLTNAHHQPTLLV